MASVLALSVLIWLYLEPFPCAPVSLVRPPLPRQFQPLRSTLMVSGSKAVALVISRTSQASDETLGRYIEG